MEVFYQISLQIILVLMTNTKTATTSGLQTYFQQNTIWGLNPSIVLGFSIAWSLRTAITLHVKTIKEHKIFFYCSQSFFVGVWALFATSRRVLSIVCFFVPSLGLQDILYHWLAEQFPFSIKKKYKMIHPKDEVHLFNMTGKLLWSDVDRWFWLDGDGNGLDRWSYYEDPDDPTPPPYTLYTGFTLQWTLVVFMMIMFFHFVSMAMTKSAASEDFKGHRSKFNKCLHILQNINFAFPWSDWDEGVFSKEEFQRRYTNTETEMLLSCAVNSFFSIIMVMPIWFTGCTKIL